MNDYFCPAPWLSFFIKPNGVVENCCLSRNNLGNVNDHSILEIIHGRRNREIKQQMLDGVRVPGCENCYRQTGGNSLQDYFLREYSNIDPTVFKDTEYFDLRYLDLRWDNTCNFACIYCGPDFSSLWAETQGQKIVKIRDSKSGLVDKVFSLLDNLDTLYLAGGEPLMLKDNEKILSRLLEVNQDCRICINTNLSLIENNKIFEILKGFKNVQWLISAESMANQYEYIRWPGKWTVFDKNLKMVKESFPIGLSFNMVLMNLNALSIWDFIDYLNQKFDIPHRNITVNIYNMRDSNGAFAIQRLTDQQRQLVIQRISDQYDNVLGIQNIKDSLQDDRSDYRDKWNGLEFTKETLKSLDEVRFLNSQTVFPNIYQIIDNEPEEIYTIYGKTTENTDGTITRTPPKKL